MFKAYNASSHPLSSEDIGGLVVAIIELCCLEVGGGQSTFSRVGFCHVPASCFHRDVVTWS